MLLLGLGEHQARMRTACELSIQRQLNGVMSEHRLEVWGPAIPCELPWLTRGLGSWIGPGCSCSCRPAEYAPSIHTRTNICTHTSICTDRAEWKFDFAVLTQSGAGKRIENSQVLCDPREALPPPSSFSFPSVP